MWTSIVETTLGSFREKDVGGPVKNVKADFLPGHWYPREASSGPHIGFDLRR
jgi:hypothetical protein